MARFADVFEDVTKEGHKIPKENYLPNGLYPIIDQGQEYIAGYSNDADGLYSNVPAIIFGDHTRIIKYVDMPFFLGADGVKLLRAKKSNANYKYLYYALSNSNIPNTGYNRHFKWLKEIDIPIPSELQQASIVKVLDKVSGLIALRKQQLAKLDDLVKARFVEMFGDNKRLPQASFGTICTYLRNGANIRQEAGAGGIPITRIETLTGGVFHPERLGYANITDVEKYRNFFLQPGDILISHINSAAYLGRAVQYHGEVNTPVIHGMNLLCARLVPTIAPTYVEWFFKSAQAKEYISSITKKAVNQASITATDLKKMPVPIPSEQEQITFSQFSAQVDKCKLTVQQGLDKMEIVKKALMQKYFDGSK